MSRATIHEPMRPTPMKAIFSPTRAPASNPLRSSLAAAAAAGIDIYTHLIDETGTHRRIARQHQRIVPRNDMLRRTGQRLNGRQGIEIGRDIVDDRKWPPLKPIGVKMRRVQGQHHPAALRV